MECECCGSVVDVLISQITKQDVSLGNNETLAHCHCRMVRTKTTDAQCLTEVFRPFSEIFPKIRRLSKGRLKLSKLLLVPSFSLVVA